MNQYPHNLHHNHHKDKYSAFIYKWNSKQTVIKHKFNVHYLTWADKWAYWQTYLPSQYTLFADDIYEA